MLLWGNYNANGILYYKEIPSIPLPFKTIGILHLTSCGDWNEKATKIHRVRMCGFASSRHWQKTCHLAQYEKRNSKRIFKKNEKPTQDSLNTLSARICLNCRLVKETMRLKVFPSAQFLQWRNNIRRYTLFRSNGDAEIRNF